MREKKIKINFLRFLFANHGLSIVCVYVCVYICKMLLVHSNVIAFLFRSCITIENKFISERFFLYQCHNRFYAFIRFYVVALLRLILLGLLIYFIFFHLCGLFFRVNNNQLNRLKSTNRNCRQAGTGIYLL